MVGTAALDIPRRQAPLEPPRGSAGASRATANPWSSTRILHRDDPLFHVGDPADGVYRVVSGALKSCIPHADGEEQVLAFHSPGDLVGYDALAQETRDCSVIALDTSKVEYLRVSGAAPYGATAGLKEVIAAMYGDMQRLCQRLHMGRADTRRRVAEFLLSHADGLAARGLSATEFVLPMRRRELALYLGLAPETLCRTLAALRERGEVEVERNWVYIRDRGALAETAGRATR